MVVLLFVFAPLWMTFFLIFTELLMEIEKSFWKFLITIRSLLPRLDRFIRARYNSMITSSLFRKIYQLEKYTSLLLKFENTNRYSNSDNLPNF